MNNPWKDLSATPPFIAPTDRHYIDSRINHLQLEVLPDPYIGNLNQARIVLLALNPGYKNTDLSVNMNEPGYTRQNKLNLLHKANPPFYMLDKRLNYSGGYKWWSRILKPLISAGIPIDSLSRKVMCIQYFPSHSRTYINIPIVLPSQGYSFFLLKEAIRQNKKIVVMRSEKLWLNAVPELIDVNYIKLKNPRNPVISPNNMEEKEFTSIVKLLLNE